MASPLKHFSINADDVDATRRFYEKVLGWKFSAWGPPDFYMIDTGDHPHIPLRGSLQKRRYLAPGKPTIGYECSVSVEDVDATARLVEKHGGRIVMQRTTLAGVGYLIFFEDPSGNIAGAMQYDEHAE